MSKRFKNMEEVDDYLEKQIQFDDSYRCIIDIIQEKNTCLVNFINSLIEENKQLRQTIQKVCKLLEEEVDLFSEKATEHDIIAYREMQEFDNKDAYYICTATKKAIQMLKR